MTDVDPAPSGTTDRPRGPSRWSLVTAVAIAAAVVLAVPLAAMGLDALREDRPRAGEGQVFDQPRVDEPLSGTGTVFLPWARLSVAVGEPRSELPEIGSVPSDVAPPDGGSFVRVEVGATSEAEVPLVSVRDSVDAHAQIVLVADDEEYPVDGPTGLGLDAEEPLSFPTGDPEARWVAVSGEPTDVAVEVVVDGQVQTVERDGDVTRRRAQDLAEVPSYDEVSGSSTTGCGTARREDGSSLRLQEVPTCEVTASLRTPYVDGLGWAPRGREYLAVEVQHSDLLPEGPEGILGWQTTSEFDGRLDGRRPTERPTTDPSPTPARATDNRVHPQLVFEVPADEPTDDLSLRVDADAVPEDPFADHARVRFEWTIPGSDLA